MSKAREYVLFMTVVVGHASRGVKRGTGQRRRPNRIQVFARECHDQFKINAPYVDCEQEASCSLRGSSFSHRSSEAHRCEYEMGTAIVDYAWTESVTQNLSLNGTFVPCC
jgi:hypothetical protein